MRLCGSLCNFACGNANGKKQAIAGGIEVLLASINNHLGCAIICGYACSGLFNIVFGSKENAELLISLGGGAAVAKSEPSGRIPPVFKPRFVVWPI
jgi:hypothetical protein